MNKFCTAYLDNVLVYSKTLAEHQSNVCKVLEKLQDAGLLVDITKSQFHAKEVTFLGMIVLTQGLKMNPNKVAAIKECEPPKTLHNVQSFNGLANFYKQFIKGFSTLGQPPIYLTKKDVRFYVSPATLALFESVKTAFISGPI